MKTNPTAPNYKGFRFPSEIISHAVWLYFRFSLSFRDVEEILAQRGIVVTYETVRQWCLKFGQSSANELRRRRPRCGDKWYMDEMVLTIRGKEHYLWRAVDQDGNVYGLDTSWFFQTFDDEKLNKRADDRLEDEHSINFVHNGSAGRTH
jgi:putative transposase